MIETEITILIYRKTDIDIITQKICEKKMQVPVFILEYENYYQLKLSSDYEQWELDSAISECFPEYEFTTDLANGKKEIRVQISRYQSEDSTDRWGRPIENPLNEVKYLIKKQAKSPEKFNPRIKVLFEESIQEYCINIANGVNAQTGEKGFLLLNHFKGKDASVTPEVLKDKLYKSIVEAFQCGFYKLQTVVNNDFKEYQKEKKKKIAEEQKIPRKVIREFVRSCNNADVDGVMENLVDNFVYINRLDWQKEIRIEGKEEFVKHIKSSSQNLYPKNYIIRSQWIFGSYGIRIGVKYLPPRTANTKDNLLAYEQFTFVLRDYKIETIWHEK